MKNISIIEMNISFIPTKLGQVLLKFEHISSVFLATFCTAIRKKTKKTTEFERLGRRGALAPPEKGIGGVALASGGLAEG